MAYGAITAFGVSAANHVEVESAIESARAQTLHLLMAGNHVLDHPPRQKTATTKDA